MERFRWISNQLQWDSAIAALLLLDLPMSLLDDGGNVRRTVIKDEDVGIAVLSEKSSADGRGGTAWRQRSKTYFTHGVGNSVAQFNGSSLGDRCLLSLALHTAGKPHKRFTELVSRCKGSVTLEMNGHRDTHETVEEWIDDDPASLPSRDVVREMIEDDTTVSLQFYPATPIGFHMVMHHDVDAAIEAAHAILDAS